MSRNIFICILALALVCIVPLAQSTCQQVGNSWTFKRPADFSQHILFGEEDNPWLMGVCESTIDSSRKFGLDFFVVGIDPFSTVITPPIYQELACTGNPEDERVYAWAVGIADPQTNPAVHWVTAGEYSAPQIVATNSGQDVPMQLDSPAWHYNQATLDPTRFALFISANDSLTNTPGYVQLDIEDLAGPQPLGQKGNGIVSVPLSDGSIDNATQFDQVLMRAKGYIAAYGQNTPVRCDIYVSHQWSTHPPGSGASSDNYIWLYIVIKKRTTDPHHAAPINVVFELARYYSNTSYIASTSVGGGNVLVPLVPGDARYNPSSIYKVQYKPAVALASNEFTFHLLDPVVSPFTGRTDFTKVRVVSNKFNLDVTSSVLVTNNEFPGLPTYYSEAPTLITGTYNGDSIVGTGTIESLKTA